MNTPAPAGFRGRFLTDPADRAPHGESSGILRSVPRAVTIPADADDLARLVRWAAESSTPLVPRGAGTGMPGGNVGGGVAVDMVSGFRSIGEPDPRLGRLRTGPGVTLAELNARSAPAGFHFPVDPSSGARASMGGLIANNSGGAHSVKYGSTRRWVRALDLVLADGSRCSVERGVAPDHPSLAPIAAEVVRALGPHHELVEARWPRVRKNSSGYAVREYLATGDLLDLVVGSEGTLALITGAVVDLAPIPRCRGLAFLEFTSLEAAGEAVVSVLAAEPATCEMLDRTFLDLVREGGDVEIPLAEGLEAVLLVEVEGEGEADVARALERVRDTVAATAAGVSTAVDPERQHQFWEVRHAASPIIKARSGGRVSMQFIEDGVVPVARLPEYVRALRDILARHRLPAVIFGHAGDGNLHVNPLVDVRAPGWRDTLEQVLAEVADAIARLGGTLSGEHGDGRLRAPFLETVWGPDLVALFRAVKHAFDPAGILNPGVILPLPGQRPFDGIRY